MRELSAQEKQQIEQKLNEADEKAKNCKCGRGRFSVQAVETRTGDVKIPSFSCKCPN